MSGITLTIGKYPIPRKIWNMNTMAVAPNAAPCVPVESSAAARIKHNDRPAADIMRRARRPYLSTVYERC